MIINNQKKKQLFAAACAAAALSVLTSCAAAGINQNTGADGSEQTAVSQNQSAADQETKQQEIEIPEDKQELLNKVTQAIEGQFPGMQFTDLPKEEIDGAASFFESYYVLAGRESDSGFSYIAGVNLQKENPLAELNCGSGNPESGYSLSQFADGQFILMEQTGGDTNGLSELYSLLEMGAAGIDLLSEAASKDVSYVMPENGPYLRVMTVKGQTMNAEYISLSEEEYTSLINDQPAALGEGTAETLLLVPDGRGQGSQGENGAEGPSESPVTEAMIRLAEERCGYQPSAAIGTESFVKAELMANLDGEERSETLQNREDLERISQMAAQITPNDSAGLRGNYEGKLTLSRQDGSEVTVFLMTGSDDCVLGSSSYSRLQQGDAEEIWSLFTTIDGFRRYGSRIRIQMEQDIYEAEQAELTFVLENETGRPLEYILSPLIYKKTETGWQQVTAVAGFCGVVSLMEGSSETLSVPWDGAFEPDGDGTYRLEIQVMPEDGLRFAVSDTFELNMTQPQQ